MSQEKTENEERFVDLRPECALDLPEIESIFNEIKVVFKRFLGANRVNDPEEVKIYNSLVKLIQSLQTEEKTNSAIFDGTHTQKLRDTARTLMGRLHFFTMMAQARGWEDDLTKKSWNDLIQALTDL